MANPVHEHLEHFEHAQHTAHGGHGHGEPGHGEAHPAGHDLDKKVAMTMAIVAALLAAVTLMSHRSHNETLRLEGEANRHQTEANIKHTQASDAWAYFQAKNNRLYQAESFVALAGLAGPAASADEKTVEKAKATVESWEKKAEKYKEELPELQKKAEELVAQGHESQEHSEHVLHEAHTWHEKGDRFDAAELAVELALVLCSVTVLTKRSVYWYAGIAFGAVGLVVALSAFLIGGH